MIMDNIRTLPSKKSYYNEQYLEQIDFVKIKHIIVDSI